MKKILILLVSIVAGGVGYRIYTQNKREELNVPREKEIGHNDYVVYFEDEEEVPSMREEMFI